jgi:SAM-dependent methyltransferase
MLDRIERVSTFAQRLEADTGRGFAAVVQRLEKGLAELGNVVHRLDGRLADGLNAIPPAIVAELNGAAQRFDVASIATHLDQLANTVSQVSALAQRLDADAVQGFSAISERLERDLVLLSQNLHQSTSRVVALVEELLRSHNEQNSVLGRLVFDLGDGAAVRPSDRRDTQASSPARKNSERRPSDIWTRTSTNDLPVSIPIALGADSHVWTLKNGELARKLSRPAELIDVMLAGRSSFLPGDRFAWLWPNDGRFEIQIEEMRQLAGLIGPVEWIGDIEQSGQRRRVAFGKRRVEALSILLRWSLAALEAFHIRIGSVMREAANRYDFQAVLHSLDLPDIGSDFNYWAQHVRPVAELISQTPGAAPGISLPFRFERDPNTVNDALKHVQDELSRAGAPSIAFQWARGPVPISSSPYIYDFACANGISFDFTPVPRTSTHSLMHAYEDRVPYRSMSFDLRTPTFDSARNGPIEIARRSGRELAYSDVHSVPTLLDADFEKTCARLAAVLDRSAQEQYQREVNLDPVLTSHWPQHFIYNWAPPLAGSLRLIEFEAAELAEHHSPVARLHNDKRLEPADLRWKTGADFLSIAERMASETFDLSASPKAIQVEAHQYQKTDRPDITADAEYLVSWMPADIGLALEIGCGLGVMARRIAKKAQRYLGLDLTVEQAASVHSAGGIGLVSDIHSLPFPDDSIDTVIADNVIEHSLDPIRALSECQRVLRPGGHLFMLIPHDFSNSHFQNGSHFWKADEDSVRNALRVSQLEVIRYEKVRLPELGVSGAYPSSDGQTGLWWVGKPTQSA